MEKIKVKVKGEETEKEFVLKQSVGTTQNVRSNETLITPEGSENDENESHRITVNKTMSSKWDQGACNTMGDITGEIPLT